MMPFPAMNSIKLLEICGMLLSQPKETTSHGLRWNNSPVSPVVMFCFFFFAEVWNLYTQC